MPKTKFQEFIYGVLMTFFMVFAMELYNTGLKNHGLSNADFLPACKEMAIIFPICFIMGFFFVDRFAPKIAFKMVTPDEDKPFLVNAVRACVTVCFMYPIMSFWATLIFKQPGLELIPKWLQTFVCNFPMALLWQLFFCGPLVRFLFKKIFRQEKAADAGQI